MPSDYNAITKHNERQLGQDTASRKTQISMYSDSTHFVFELLQNADDYGATEVFFKLSENKLLIEHDGEPFTEENVRAITYFGQSTSRDDLVKTGRFGVGFKSVFAFTATPIIISGDEHFQIYGLYRVREHPYPDGLSRSRTRIVLPFNHASEQPDYVEDLMSEEGACSKISDRLKTLSMNTLLFTRNIREIRWEIGGRSGHYLREDDTNDNARRTTITDGEHLEKYLVFSRVPRWKNQEHKAVEIVFALDEQEQITSADDFLYVLFATRQETHLQFILNGPYRTNPSRETISEDDPFNLHLIKETCELMREVLLQLRERKLLTTQFLSVLPNNNELRDFYAPIFDTIVETFCGQELVPTDDNQHASAANVRQGPAPIREVITKAKLAFFIGHPGVRWAKGVQQNSRADNFLSCLGFEQWGWKEFQEALRSKWSEYLYPRRINDDAGAWLDERGDAWLQKLYLLLADAIRRPECSERILKSFRIIRVRKGGSQHHVTGSQAYFPKRGYGNLPRIKPSILQGKNLQEEQKIYESLVALGVSEIGEEERIDSLLETSYSDESGLVSTQQHLQHIRAFIEWWKKEKNARKFESYAIFYVDGKRELRKPSECFLDSPLRKSGLSAIYSQNASNIPRKLKLWKGYQKIVGEGFCDFAIACGIVDRLPIKHQPCWKHALWSEIREGLGGARETATRIDEDYYIPDLNKLLKLRKCPINLLIWDVVREAGPKMLEAQYRPNQQYGKRGRKSSLVIELTDVEWIPDKKGRLHKPCNLTKEQLHLDFKYDNRNGWLDKIGFGEKAKEENEEYKKRKEGASSLGVPVELVDYLSVLSEEERKKELEELRDYANRKNVERKRAQRIQQESIPYDKALSEAFSAPNRGIFSNGGESRGNGGLSQNPSRRREKTQKDIAAAIKNEGEREERFFFTLRKTWTSKNDQVRVNLAEWYGGRCQICEKTFTQSNSEPYFEGLHLVSHTTAEWIDRVGNVLCLCPWHSAMFQFGTKEVEEDIPTQVMRLKAQAEGGDGRPVLRMKLCEDLVEIKYAEKHLIDLQEMIRATQKSAQSEVAVADRSDTWTEPDQEDLTAASLRYAATRYPEEDLV